MLTNSRTLASMAIRSLHFRCPCLLLEGGLSEMPEPHLCAVPSSGGEPKQKHPSARSKSARQTFPSTNAFASREAKKGAKQQGLADKESLWSARQSVSGKRVVSLPLWCHVLLVLASCSQIETHDSDSKRNPSLRLFVDRAEATKWSDCSNASVARDELDLTRSAINAQGHASNRTPFSAPLDLAPPAEPDKSL